MRIIRRFFNKIKSGVSRIFVFLGGIFIILFRGVFEDLLSTSIGKIQLFSFLQTGILSVSLFKKSDSESVFIVKIWMLIVFILGLIFFCFFLYKLCNKRYVNGTDASITKKLKELTEDIEDVDGIVLYKYSIKRNKAIVFEHKASYAEHDVSLNIMYREIIQIPKRLYGNLTKLAEAYNQYLKNPRMYDNAKQAALTLKENAKKILFDKTNETTDEKCCIYQIYRIAEEVILHKPYVKFVLPSEFEPYEIELLCAKRTGMLGSAFFNDTRLIYNYKHLKKNRAYVAIKAMDFNNSNSYVFLCITNALADGTKDDIEKYEKAIARKFGFK